MLVNHIVSFLCWLVGVLQVIGFAGGLCFWAVVIWMICSRKGSAFWVAIFELEEFRCNSCEDRNTCPAAGTGSLYPCWWYKEKDKP